MAAECAEKWADKRSKVATDIKELQLPDRSTSSAGEEVISCDMSHDHHVIVLYVGSVWCSGEVLVESGAASGGTIATLIPTLFTARDGTVSVHLNYI